MERQQSETLDGIALDHRARYRFAAERIQGRILDAACGTGYGSRIVNASVGVDASRGAIEWANRYFPGPQYLCGRIESHPWEGKFDAVVSFETLEHLEHASLAVLQFAASLKPDGMLVCSVPNERLYPFEAHRYTDDEYPHRRHYTPEAFAELLQPWFRIEEKHCQLAKDAATVIPGTNGKILIYVCRLLPQR